MRLRRKEAAPAEATAPVDIDAVLRQYAKDHPPRPSELDSTVGAEFWDDARHPKVHPLPPEHYPRSGSACYRCPGTEDPRCCQYKNQVWDVPE